MIEETEKTDIDDFNEEEYFEYQIWELNMKIETGELHLREFKKTNKRFKSPEKRIKGTDTVFYEINLPEWHRMLKISFEQFEKDYERKYSKSRVRYPKKRGNIEGNKIQS